MENEVNELVKRLTEKQEVEFGRPRKESLALKECIDRDFVHVMFKKTTTELGVRLDRKSCKLNEGDFANANGKVHLVGKLILNYNKVKCVADIDLATCEGYGYLEPISDAEYQSMDSNLSF